jgi:hypothetical protein
MGMKQQPMTYEGIFRFIKNHGFTDWVENKSETKRRFGRFTLGRDGDFSSFFR